MVVENSSKENSKQAMPTSKRGPTGESVAYKVSPLIGTISLGSSWERRWQTLAMFSCSLYFILPSTVLAWAVTIHCLAAGFVGGTVNTVLASLMVVYLSYILFVDNAPRNGARSPFLRSLKWWEYSCDYLPILLVKTAELPAGHNYVLGYHPHGIISVGCFGAFATDGAKALDLTQKKKTKKPTKADDDEEDTAPLKRGFSSLFPGLDRHVMTLAQNFVTPFLREYLLSMGSVDAAPETFQTILAKPSTAVVVVVGGAAESLHTEEGGLDLVLETRRGFVREAILANASLVPVLAFGENDLYKTFDTSGDHWIVSLQRIVKQYTGIAVPVFAGRSIFFKDIGVMPQRKPVIVVVGKPIPPPKLTKAPKMFAPEIDYKTDNALNEDGEILKQHHAAYIQALEDLYDEYREASWNIPGHQLHKEMQILKK